MSERQKIEVPPGVGETLAIPETEEYRLTRRLDTFMSKFAQYFTEHQRKLRDNLSGESRRWDELLGIVSPDQLLNRGVGMPFLVIWNNQGVDVNQDGRWTDMEVWLAKGISIQKTDGNEKLIINYYDLGYIKAGGTGFINKKPRLLSDLSGRDSILTSTGLVLN